MLFFTSIHEITGGGILLNSTKTIHKQRKLAFSRKTWLLLIGIILIATTLRSPLTSVGPILSFIRDTLHLSNFATGLITTIPLLAFAIISPLAPTLSKRFGLDVTLIGALVILLSGIVIRSTGNTTLLFIGTFFIGVAIAFGNVLLPGLLKLSFPYQIGLMTGIYSVAMNLSATIASGVSVPIALNTPLGWQFALGIWGVLAVGALIVWLFLLGKIEKGTENKAGEKSNRKLRTSSLAWSITFFMGLQSLLFYTTSGWIPIVLQANGLPADQAGWMLSLVQLTQVPMMFIIPIIADKVKNQRTMVIWVAVLYLIGYGGVMTGNSVLTPLWMTIIGIAGGASFGLAMMFFTLRTTTPMEASELSGMAQSVGYLLAAVGPVLFGIVHDMTESWIIPLNIFIIGTILLLLCGLKAGKDEKLFQT